MHAVICVYLHGFLSSGQSQKGRWLLEKLRIEVDTNQAATAPGDVHPPQVFKEFLTLTYPIGSPLDSIQAIEAALQPLRANQNSSLILMGSSMGGYYAQFLGQKYTLPYIMINPALNPRPIFLENLGAHVNPSTGEELVIDLAYIQQVESFDVPLLNPKVPAMLLIDEGDEVIDKEWALSLYSNRADTTTEVHLFKGGDHAFQHMEEAWPLIKAFVAGLEPNV